MWNLMCEFEVFTSSFFFSLTIFFIIFFNIQLKEKSFTPIFFLKNKA